MRLYYAPHPSATPPRWMLEELRVTYELARVGADAPPRPAGGEPGRPAPATRVPELIDGALSLSHAAAICAYLADKHADRDLAPRAGTRDRAAYRQWLAFGAATLDVAVKLARFAKSSGDADAFAAAEARFAEVARVLSAALRQPYVVGDRFTAADVVVGSALHWADALGLAAPHANVARYTERLRGREAFRRACAD